MIKKLTKTRHGCVPINKRYGDASNIVEFTLHTNAGWLDIDLKEIDNDTKRSKTVSFTLTASEVEELRTMLNDNA